MILGLRVPDVCKANDARKDRGLTVEWGECVRQKLGSKDLIRSKATSSWLGQVRWGLVRLGQERGLIRLSHVRLD